MKQELYVQLDKLSDEPLYIQLYKVFKNMIESGQLQNNEKLPSIRKISAQISINNSTVINAYKLLEKNGFAYSQTGSGTYVFSKKAVNSNVGMQLQYNITENTNNIIGEKLINFANLIPDSKLFPVNAFKDIINEVLDRDGGSAFGYTEIKGYTPLRESLMEYANCYNIKCNLDDIQIISGAQQGIDIIAKALIDYGDILITEKPTYTGAIAVFKSRGAEIIDIPIQVGGIDITELENILKHVKPKFVYMMTNFQNPTGYSYSNDTKEKLLLLANKFDFYIIEDDFLSELYYTDEKPILLKAMDYNNRVIFIKSFSKIFMPGIRIGFLIVPEKVRDRVVAAKYLTDISTSGFMQRVFDLYIRKNMLSIHMKNIRSGYIEIYRMITEYIDNTLREVSYYKPNGGIHLWLKLPDSISSNALYSECLINGVIISSGSIFYNDSIDSQNIRLSYASTNIDSIKMGIDIINRTIESLRSRGY